VRQHHAPEDTGHILHGGTRGTQQALPTRGHRDTRVRQPLLWRKHRAGGGPHHATASLASSSTLTQTGTKPRNRTSGAGIARASAHHSHKALAHSAGRSKDMLRQALHNNIWCLSRDNACVHRSAQPFHSTPGTLLTLEDAKKINIEVLRYLQGELSGRGDH
jgi:hypothetical protein